jgi:hypothetical protein
MWMFKKENVNVSGYGGTIIVRWTHGNEKDEDETF